MKEGGPVAWGRLNGKPINHVPESNGWALNSCAAQAVEGGTSGGGWRRRLGVVDLNATGEEGGWGTFQCELIYCAGDGTFCCNGGMSAAVLVPHPQHRLQHAGAPPLFAAMQQGGALLQLRIAVCLMSQGCRHAGMCSAVRAAPCSARSATAVAGICIACGAADAFAPPQSSPGASQPPPLLDSPTTLRS